MLLAQKMWEHPTEYCEGWNFGPDADSVSTVWEIATKLVQSFGRGELNDISDSNVLHEANLLMLDITKAKTRLNWKPRLNALQTIDLVADWYKRYQMEEVYTICINEIERFLDNGK